MCSLQQCWGFTRWSCSCFCNWCFRKALCLLSYHSQFLLARLCHVWPFYLWYSASSSGSSTGSHRPQLQSTFSLHPVATCGFWGRSLPWQLCLPSDAPAGLEVKLLRRCFFLPAHAVGWGWSKGKHHPCRVSRASCLLTVGISRRAGAALSPGLLSCGCGHYYIDNTQLFWSP